MDVKAYAPHILLTQRPLWRKEDHRQEPTLHSRGQGGHSCPKTTHNPTSPADWPCSAVPDTPHLLGGPLEAATTLSLISLRYCTPLVMSVRMLGPCHQGPKHQILRASATSHSYFSAR